MKHLSVPLLALLTLTQPAYALSCLRPSLVTSYQQVAEAPDLYDIFRGRLDFVPAPPPAKDQGIGTAPQTGPINATFEGLSLITGEAGPTEVTLMQECAGPWCAGIMPSDDAVVYLRQTDSGWVLDYGPCGGRIFESPSPADLDGLDACIRGNCPAEPE